MNGTQIPRGIRNNNPGNVEFDPHTCWDGLAVPANDGRFCKFTDMKYGVRVIAKLLLAYQKYHGLNTSRAIIDRWAPPVENDTDQYAGLVATALGVGPDDQIHLTDINTLLKFVRAITVEENGKAWPVDEAKLREGCSMAITGT